MNDDLTIEQRLHYALATGQITSPGIGGLNKMVDEFIKSPEYKALKDSENNES